MPAESPNNFAAIIPSAEAAKSATANVKISPADDSPNATTTTIFEKLDSAFGVAIESSGSLAPEFDSSPEAILKLQTMIRRLNVHSDKVDIAFHLDDMIMEAVNCIQPQANQMDTEFGTSLGQIYNIPQFDASNSNAAASVFDYLFAFYARCNSLVNQNRTGILAPIFICLSERVRVQFILFLRGLLHANTSHQDVSVVFTKFLINNATVCQTFLNDLVVCCKNSNLTDSEALAEVFNPVLDILRSCASNNAFVRHFDAHCEVPFNLVKTLLEIRLADNSRPIADLIAAKANFHPKVFHTKKYHGREFVHTSFLGPFFSLSVAGSQSVQYDTNFEEAEVAFKEADVDGPKEAKIGDYQTRLSMLRTKMHSIFHGLILNASTRKATLDYIAEMFERNRKLAQIQAEYEQLANGTAMLNMLSILLDLSEKVVVEKIQDDYIFHPNSLLKVHEESGIKMDRAQLDSYRSAIDLSYTPTFNTECFYLTLAYFGISLSMLVNNHRRTKRNLYEIQRQVRDLEERINRIKASSADSSTQMARNTATLQRAADLLKKFSLSNMCYECLLYDPTLLAKCTVFVNKLLRLLLRNIMPGIWTDLAKFKPCLERFTSFPETFLENGVDFMHFLFGGGGQRFKILLANMVDYPQLILHLVVNLSNIKNPFLASKIVDLLFYICPDVHHEGSLFFRQLMNDPLAVQKLFPALVKFYADVESTGSHTEFYDKFNIRRNIQIIFQNMWRDLAHRDRMIKFAGESSPDFYRFINMVINDTTFLLDESLEKLKRIHEIECQMANEAEWSAQSEEERRQRLDILVDAKRQVKTWLQLGSETMELFSTLTGDAPQIFRQEALGERVAAMLNHNLIQLCGPKCSALKVNDAQARFNWDPRRLTEQIVKVYTNLASEQFAKQIAQDERSYKVAHFDQVLKTLEKLLPISQFELFKQLATEVKKAHEAKALFEEEFEEDCPEEFRCAIMFTMMSDPVTIPSGQVVERKNILRHLLSDPHNPFNRQPLTEKDLKPNNELKAQISSWVRGMKQRKMEEGQQQEEKREEGKKKE